MPIEFADVVTGDSVGESVRRNETRLTPHVPPEMASDSNEVLTTVRTPQFRQAAEIFGHALQSGQLAPVLPQLGVSEAASRAAASGGEQRDGTIVFNHEMVPFRCLEVC